MLVSNEDSNDKYQGEETFSKKYLRLVKENIGSGITVALVSVPLSTALSIASGCTPMMGLSAAIYGPLVAGLIGGSDYNILGPAGALVNILSGLVAEDGQKIIPLVAFVSGIFAAIVWALKLEKFCALISISVLEGFSLSVAVAIGCGQLNNAFGLGNLPRHKEFYENLYETFLNLGSTNFVEFIPFFIFFVILMALAKYLPGKPWIVLIAIVGTLYGYIMTKFAPSFKPTLLRDKYPEMGNGNISIIDFSYLKNEIPVSHIIVGAMKVAFVAVLETLISARIADNLTGTRFDQSKECRGLAVANLLCGLFGATPCTGVLVRTAVNVSSGATSMISQFINGIVVFIVIFVLMPAFTYIPMPIIASILITSSCRLFPKKIIAHLFHADKFECFMLLFTAAMCIFIDGALGLLIGGCISLLVNASQSPLMTVVVTEDQKSFVSDRNVLTVQGSLSYLNCVKLEVEAIEQMSNKDHLIIDLQNIQFIDVDAVESLQIIFKMAKTKKIRIALVVSNSQNLPQEGETVNSILKQSTLFIQLQDNQQVFNSADQAYNCFKNPKSTSIQ